MTTVTPGQADFQKEEIHDASSDEYSQPSTRNAGSLKEALYPQDTYIGETYWADLPRGERTRWINSEFGKEAKREIGVLGAMIKADPLSPIGAYFRKYVARGAGLLVEGYVLFSIGNLSPLFQSVWPQCWKTYRVCPENLIFSVTWLQIVGIIVGQIMVGLEADSIGRRFGLIQDALVMLTGAILLTAVWGANGNLEGWVIAYTLSLFFYGIGVGGEYPLTSSSAMEMTSSNRDDRIHRGRNVVMAFLMQGIGQVLNVSVLMLSLLVFHGGKTEPPYSVTLAQWTYRFSFAVAALLHLWLLYYRIWHVKTADHVVRAAKKKYGKTVTGYDMQSFRILTGHYWHRLVATAGGWFVNDVFFYGNKVFQGAFIKILFPNASVFKTWEYSLLNAAVSLVGYYLAALLVDYKLYGRRTMQQVGFFASFILYLFSAIFYKQLTHKGAPIHWFQFLYFMSSFFTQFGANCTTFLVAAECYPAAIRGTAHGFSAASGKVGALIPTVVFNYLNGRNKFWFCTFWGLLAALLTFIFLPDTTGLDLREIERMHHAVRQGRAGDYHGPAVHPQHLSLYERVVLKWHLAYDPAKDREARIDELRILYESYLISKDSDHSFDDPEHSVITPEVEAYFANEKLNSKQRIEQQKTKEQALHESAQEKNAAYGHSRLEDALGQY